MLDRNWRCDGGEIDLVLRDGDVLVVCEVKTRTSDACGSPHEAVTPAKLGRLRRLAARWVVEHQVHPADVRIDLVAVMCRRRGPADIEHVTGSGLMALATAHTVSLHGAVGHLIDVQADVSPGSPGTTLVGRPDTSLHEAPRPLPDGGVQLGRPLAGDQAGDDPAGSVRPGEARHPLRPCHRAGRARRPVATSPERSLSDTLVIGELTLTGGLRSVPGVLPMVMAASPPWLRARDRAGAPGARGRDGAGHDGARHALAGAGARRAPRGRRPRRRAGGADVGQPAHRVAGLAAAQRARPRRPPWRPRRQVRARGRGGRRPPPDALGAEGRWQDVPGRAPAGDPARPLRRGVARAHRDPLARRAPSSRATS